MGKDKKEKSKKSSLKSRLPLKFPVFLKGTLN
jgi:hypothetical protein